MATTSTYAVHQSPLYKLSNRKRLCELLGLTPVELVALRRGKGYNNFPLPDRYGSDLPALRHKPRDVQSPEKVLKKVQKRVADMLSRIELPVYLHSARKDHSYKTNAAQHTHGHSLARIDIKKFYESTYISYVDGYFRNVLLCAPDIAHRLADISTYRKRLPTGSPLSPILSFLAYRDMFNELHELAVVMGLKMTVYVDDVVVSGPGIASRYIDPAREIVARYGLRAHKFATATAGAPLVITGVERRHTGDVAPPARFRKIRALKVELQQSQTPERKYVFLRALIGQYREGQQLIPNAKSHADRYQRELLGLPEDVRLRMRGRRRKKNVGRKRFRKRPAHAV